MTYIYKEVTESSFHDAFYKYDRQNNFSYEARQELYDYSISLAEDMGEPIELDVIALCCEWAEHESKEALEECYTKPLEDIEGEYFVIKTAINTYLIRE